MPKKTKVLDDFFLVGFYIEGGNPYMVAVDDLFLASFYIDGQPIYGSGQILILLSMD